MKVCNDKDSSYYTVKGGDVIKRLGGSYYLVTDCVKGLRLYNLDDGNIWNDASPFGSVGKGGFEKVNACLKVED